MMKMRKKLLSMLLTGAMVLSMSGMTVMAEEVDMNEDGTVNNPEAVEVADDELSFWSLFTGGDGEWFGKIVDDYNAASPANPIKRITLVWADYYTKLQTAVATGNGPDIGVSHVSKLYELADTGVIEPITDQLDELGIDLSEYFSQESIDSVTIDDDIYAIPLDTHSEVMYYNLDLLEQAGVTEDDVKGIKSAEDFEAICAKLKDALPEDNSVISLQTNGDDPFRIWYAIYFQMGGADFVNDGATECTLDVEKARAAMEWVKSLYDNGYILEGIDDQTAFFQSGKAAFCFAGTWVTGNLEATDGLNFNNTTFPLLFGDTPYCWSDSHTLTVPVNADRTDEETLEAVKFIVSASVDGGITWAGSGQIPSALKANESDEYKAMKGYNVVDELKYSKYAPLASNYYGGMKADLITALDGYWQNMDDIDSACDNVTAAIEDNLD